MKLLCILALQKSATKVSDNISGGMEKPQRLVSNVAMVVPGYASSEVKFQRDLADARTIGRLDVTEATRCEITHGITELRMIEHVEKLAPNVQGHPLVDMNVLEK